MEGFVFFRLKNLNENHGVQVLEGFEKIKASGNMEKPSVYLANMISAHQTAQGKDLVITNNSLIGQ